jgi:hypothetical protein
MPETIASAAVSGTTDIVVGGFAWPRNGRKRETALGEAKALLAKEIAAAIKPLEAQLAAAREKARRQQMLLERSELEVGAALARAFAAETAVVLRPLWANWAESSLHQDARALGDALLKAYKLELETMGSVNQCLTNGALIEALGRPVPVEHIVDTTGAVVTAAVDAPLPVLEQKCRELLELLHRLAPLARVAV